LHHTNQQNLRGAFFFGKGPSGSKSAKTAPSLKAAKPLMLDPTFDTTASSIATAKTAASTGAGAAAAPFTTRVNVMGHYMTIKGSRFV
jgi:hypothetical protein